MSLSLSYDAYDIPSPLHFPSNNVNWSLEPQRAVLLIHDMQAYFLRGLRDLSQGHAVIANAQRLLSWARRLAVPIAFTAQTGMSAEQRGLLNDFWGPGMAPTALDRDVIPELRPGDGEWRIPKWRYSAFFGNDLMARIRDADRDQIVLCGVYAHLGVTVSAVDAFSYDLETFVVGDAVADFNAECHHQALAYLVRSCAQVVSTDDIVA